MVLGMSLHAFTLLHVVICIAELFFGAVVVLMLIGGRLSNMSGLFLLSAALVSITGFLFPFKGVTPGIILGILSLITIALAAIALYSKKLAGGWRRTFAISVVITLYFDAFVGVVQSFEKIGPLHMLAPTGKEAPFAVAQGILLIIFLIGGVFAAKRFAAASTA
jgi:hypothetical protein